MQLPFRRFCEVIPGLPTNLRNHRSTEALETPGGTEHSEFFPMLSPCAVLQWFEKPRWGSLGINVFQMTHSGARDADGRTTTEPTLAFPLASTVANRSYKHFCRESQPGSWSRVAGHGSRQCGGQPDEHLRGTGPRNAD